MAAAKYPVKKKPRLPDAEVISSDGDRAVPKTKVGSHEMVMVIGDTLEKLDFFKDEQLQRVNCENLGIQITTLLMYGAGARDKEGNMIAVGASRIREHEFNPPFCKEHDE